MATIQHFEFWKDLCKLMAENTTKNTKVKKKQKNQVLLRALRVLRGEQSTIIRIDSQYRFLLHENRGLWYRTLDRKFLVPLLSMLLYNLQPYWKAGDK